MTAARCYALEGKRVWVTGHRGLVGSALVRRLASEKCKILVADRTELDLTRQQHVEDWMATNRPDAIFLAAGRVGGIVANSSHPGGFLYENMAIAINIIEAARRFGVGKLLFLGSSCIYPRLASQPIPEDALLSGPLEPTNEAYAVAKITGLKMAQAYRREYRCDFISAMPTNLYGPNDNFDLASSHVLPALMRKAHEAKLQGAAEMTVWGSGTPRREFLHVDDCADALVFLMQNYSGDSHVNVGMGKDVSVLELTQIVARAVGFAGDIVTDPAKPDGVPRKLLSVERLTALGWRPRITLEDGIAATYLWFLENQDRLRASH